MRTTLIALALSALGVSPALGSEPIPERWNRMWNTQDLLSETPEGVVYQRQMLVLHNRFWRDVYKKCAGVAWSAGIKQFRAVAVVDAGGTITEFAIFPEREALGCFSKEIVGKTYPSPPAVPYYAGFVVKLSKPDRSMRKQSQQVGTE
ncbi:hypothetical protein [Pseudoxanthomonas sp. LARHCG66]|jgi:hypothetical protein